MNALDDTLAARLADILRLSADLKVYEDPPESVDDLPAAIVAEMNGDMSDAAYNGLKEVTLTARVLFLGALRGREGLPKSFNLTRLWAGRVLGLLWTHDELAAADTAESIAQITNVKWHEGKVVYGGVDFTGIEFNIEMRVDWQMYYGSGPVGTLPN